MFTEPTVIIVGAGASVEFGLPSGILLRQQLLELSQAYAISFSKGTRSPVSSKSFDPLPNLGFNKFIQWVNTIIPDQKAELLNIGRSLELSPMPSLDEFIYANPRYNRIGKLFAAYSLFNSLYSRKANNEFPRNSTHLRNNSSVYSLGNWIAIVAAKMLGGCQDISECQRKNDVTFITFNYDTLLDEALKNFLGADERYDQDNLKLWPKIVHVNGEILFKKSYPKFKDNFSNDMGLPPSVLNDIYEQSKSIFMIRDDINKPLRDSRNTASEAIKSANKIFTLGYAFDETNNSNIGLDTISSEQRLFALNYDGNPLIENRIKKFSKNSSKINGTQSKKIGCYDAANLGFFEQI